MPRNSLHAVVKVEGGTTPTNSSVLVEMQEQLVAEQLEQKKHELQAARVELSQSKRAVSQLCQEVASSVGEIAELQTIVHEEASTLATTKARLQSMQEVERTLADEVRTAQRDIEASKILLTKKRADSAVASS